MDSHTFASVSGSFVRGDKSSDLVIVCHGKEFDVHTAVLCKRIFAFKCAVDECIAKRLEKRIPIYTAQPDILDRYLDALYTGDYSDEPAKPSEKTAEKTTEKTIDKATDKTTDKTTEKPTDKTTDKTSVKATEKATEKAIEKAAGKQKSTKAKAAQANPQPAVTEPAESKPPPTPLDVLLERLKINVAVLAISYRYSTYDVRLIAIKKYAPQLNEWTQGVVQTLFTSRNAIAEVIDMIKTIHEGSQFMTGATFEDFFQALLLLSTNYSMATVFKTLRDIHPRVESHYTTFVWATWLSITRRALEHDTSHAASAALLERAHARLAAAEALSASAKIHAASLQASNSSLSRRIEDAAARSKADIDGLAAKLRASEEELAALRAKTAGFIGVTMACARCGSLATFDLGGHIAASYVTCRAGHRFTLAQVQMMEAEGGEAVDGVAGSEGAKGSQADHAKSSQVDTAKSSQVENAKGSQVDHAKGSQVDDDGRADELAPLPELKPEDVKAGSWCVML